MFTEINDIMTEEEFSAAVKGLAEAQPMQDVAIVEEDGAEEKDWTIRSCSTGAIQKTGIVARTADEAVAKFYRLTGWDEDDPEDAVWAAEAQWND